ncbi:hypothetical protein TCON_0560 [Astathelohania contejeani]|uniref:Uncharacterized protein n=1 Tax=Astathelohania contejeani TaxID=164912 RepID=A0ABQ7I1B1_9MICR|nr:hypothetical protein TCON_0560 [Thelohania contejeani]
MVYSLFKFISLYFFNMFLQSRHGIVSIPKHTGCIENNQIAIERVASTLRKIKSKIWLDLEYKKYIKFCKDIKLTNSNSISLEVLAFKKEVIHNLSSLIKSINRIQNEFNEILYLIKKVNDDSIYLVNNIIFDECRILNDKLPFAQKMLQKIITIFDNIKNTQILLLSQIRIESRYENIKEILDLSSYPNIECSYNTIVTEINYLFIISKDLKRKWHVLSNEERMDCSLNYKTETINQCLKKRYGLLLNYRTVLENKIYYLKEIKSHFCNDNIEEISYHNAIKVIGEYNQVFKLFTNLYEGDVILYPNTLCKNDRYDSENVLLDTKYIYTSDEIDFIDRNSSKCVDTYQKCIYISKTIIPNIQKFFNKISAFLIMERNLEYRLEKITKIYYNNLNIFYKHHSKIQNFKIELNDISIKYSLIKNSKQRNNAKKIYMYDLTILDLLIYTLEMNFIICKKTLQSKYDWLVNIFNNLEFSHTNNIINKKKIAYLAMIENIFRIVNDYYEYIKQERDIYNSYAYEGYKQMGFIEEGIECLN